MSTDRTKDLIETLASAAKPIRRTRPASFRFGLWLSVQVVFAILVFSAGVRPDLPQQLASFPYLAELAILTLAVVLFGHATITASVPGSERWQLAAIALITSIAAGLFTATQPVATATQISAFIDGGFPCAVHTTLLSLLPTSWLLISLYRGAPLSAARAGTIAGAAGFLVGFTMMRVLCPADEALHIGLWHWTPVALGSLVSAIGGAVILPTWRR